MVSDRMPPAMSPNVQIVFFMECVVEVADILHVSNEFRHHPFG
jgi:hypothetical protein